MRKSVYAQARSDFEYRESIQELDDQVELDAMRLDLMREPTKAMAAEMYAAGCCLWFSEARRDGRELNIRAVAIRARWCL